MSGPLILERYRIRRFMEIYIFGFTLLKYLRFVQRSLAIKQKLVVQSTEKQYQFQSQFIS